MYSMLFEQGKKDDRARHTHFLRSILRVVPSKLLFLERRTGSDSGSAVN